MTEALRLAAHMPAELVLHVLEQALTPRQPAPRLISHANCGSQYTSAAYQARIEWAKAVPASAGRTIPTTTPRPEPAGARSKPSCCRTATSLPRSKKPAWKWHITSISTSTAATAPSYYSPHQFEYGLQTNPP